VTQHDWPAGPTGNVPVGTIIDTGTIEGTPFVSIPPAPNCMALDDAAYSVLAQLYPAWMILSDVIFGPGQVTNIQLGTGSLLNGQHNRSVANVRTR
jgi:hypothetical protein